MAPRLAVVYLGVLTTAFTNWLQTIGTLGRNSTQRPPRSAEHTGDHRFGHLRLGPVAQASFGGV